MIRRWGIYLAAMLGCVVFFVAHQGWLAWIILQCVLWLPVLSLVVSLPAMWSIRLDVENAGTVEPGEKAAVRMQASCRLPQPLWRCRVRVMHRITGETVTLRQGDPLPTRLVGQLVCLPEKCRVYDYLGLFWLKIPRVGGKNVTVWPQPVPMPQPQQLQRQLESAWRPKPGGGFAENHELRLYRPGDSLNQVHWKLTAKTGKLIIREAMEPIKGTVALTVDLKPEGLNIRMGKLLYLGQRLLAQGMHFDVYAWTGNGLKSWNVTDTALLEQAMEALLSQPAAGSGSVRDQQIPASCYCYIGGEQDEG